jgi:hypothetical protein
VAYVPPGLSLTPPQQTKNKNTGRTDRQGLVLWPWRLWSGRLCQEERRASPLQHLRVLALLQTVPSCLIRRKFHVPGTGHYENMADVPSFSSCDTVAVSETELEVPG